MAIMCNIWASDSDPIDNERQLNAVIIFLNWSRWEHHLWDFCLPRNKGVLFLFYIFKKNVRLCVQSIWSIIWWSPPFVKWILWIHILSWGSQQPVIIGPPASNPDFASQMRPPFRLSRQVRLPPFVLCASHFSDLLRLNKHAPERERELFWSVI